MTDKIKKLLIEYSSNNSGGGWWLEDKDWEALEKKGWLVVWSSQEFIYNDGSYDLDEKGLPKLEGEKNLKVRWLGALAKYAFKHFNSLEEAIDEFEEITGQDTDKEGCSCCGEPHNFYVKN